MDTLVEQIERVKRSLDVLPGQLAEARRAVSDRRKDVDAAKSNVDDREAEALILVTGETNEAGKPLFTNKEAREAEVRKRLRDDEKYRQSRASLEVAETAKFNAELHLNQLQDEERSLDRLLDAVAHQIRSESIRELTKSVMELTALEAKRLAGMGTR